MIYDMGGMFQKTVYILRTPRSLGGQAMMREA